MDISAEIAAIQAASQGSELRQPLVGALNKLNSGSLPSVTVSDAGKILKVGANGWEVGEKSGYMPVPTATKQITENGIYDVIDFASAQVHVSGGGSSTLIPKTITQNGTYDPADDNADGYSEIIANIIGKNLLFVSRYGTPYHVKGNGSTIVFTPSSVDDACVITVSGIGKMYDSDSWSIPMNAGMLFNECKLRVETEDSDLAFFVSNSTGTQVYGLARKSNPVVPINIANLSESNIRVTIINYGNKTFNNETLNVKITGA